MTAERVQLLVADVDGTLLTPDRELTARTRRAVEALRDAGVQLALTSGRPPRGLRMFVEPLALDTPLAAFNGGLFVDPELRVLEQHLLAPEAARRAVRTLEEHALDVWVYRGMDWYVRRLDAPHVEHEQAAVCFAPTVTADLDALLDEAVKIVGVTDDRLAITRCENAVQALDVELYAARSQPYYLDVTHPEANKGNVVRSLSQRLGIEIERIASIGDMPNDVRMFEAGGLSIAMGNASADVQREAQHVAASNTEEGFARAVEEIVLRRA